MTNEEALVYFKRRKEQIELSDKVQQAENKAIEALEKQIANECELIEVSWEKKLRKPFELKYIPTCPRGYTDCVYDPAYIKINYPDWYEDLYGDKTPEEASYECQERMRKDPDEKDHCYDNEDK